MQKWQLINKLKTVEELGKRALNPQLRIEIAKEGGIIALIAILLSSGSSMMVREKAASALQNLAFDNNKVEITKEGVLNHLLNY